MASNSQAKWSTLGSELVFGRDFTVRSITMETVRFSPGKFKLSETQKVFNFLILQQYNNGKRNLVLHVKGYRSKFADGRRRLRAYTKRRSVRSLKETMSYNRQLTNLTFLGPYWEILALGRFCTPLALPRPRANIPLYGPYTWLERG